MKKYCLLCGKLLVNRQTKYCCPAHQKEYEYQEWIKKWKNGEEEGWTGTGIKNRVRKYLFEKNDNKCELCGWGEINPYTNKIPLEVHHIDGNYKNSIEKNLQLLCPNCHSLTSNYKSLNKDSVREERNKYFNRKQINTCLDCKKEISKNAKYCQQCAGKHNGIYIPLEDMPVTREELKNLIREKPFTQIGKQFNVSDNAIRKWCNKFNLPNKKSEIKSYSDEEWSLI